MHRLMSYSWSWWTSCTSAVVVLKITFRLRIVCGRTLWGTQNARMGKFCASKHKVFPECFTPLIDRRNLPGDLGSSVEVRCHGSICESSDIPVGTCLQVCASKNRETSALGLRFETHARASPISNAETRVFTFHFLQLDEDVEEHAQLRRVSDDGSSLEGSEYIAL